MEIGLLIDSNRPLFCRLGLKAGHLRWASVLSNHQV